MQLHGRSSTLRCCVSWPPGAATARSRAELFISPRTASAHVSNILAKLEVYAAGARRQRPRAGGICSKSLGPGTIQSGLRPVLGRAEGESGACNESHQTVRGGHGRSRHREGQPTGRERHPSAAAANNNSNSFIGALNHTKVVASTIPPNGDVNPYGVAVVPRSTGNLQRAMSWSATSTTAPTCRAPAPRSSRSPRRRHVAVRRDRDPGCPGGVGLTTALVALRSGWVIVGSLPTQNNGATLSGPGCLIVLDQWGTYANHRGPGIDGPWDMTALDGGNSPNCS